MLELLKKIQNQANEILKTLDLSKINVCSFNPLELCCTNVKHIRTVFDEYYIEAVIEEAHPDSIELRFFVQKKLQELNPEVKIPIFVACEW